jgi:hypothetical protein|tara:strand:+ start:366 stop:659 length:294 start_codon:yes stop_codon:yes gene_type:complete
MDNIINMKRITLLLIMTTSLMSFKHQPPLWADGPIDKTAYDIRLNWIQERCRMLEDMFEEQYKDGELNAEFTFFYMKMVRSMDSCAADLKHFKVLFK